MPISKLKNLIILILLAATGFLLALVVPNKLAQSRQKQAQHRELISLFSSYGIALSEQILPQEQTLYTVELPNTQSCGSALAAALFENPVLMQDAASRENCTFTDQNGNLSYDSGGHLRVTLRQSEEVSSLKSGAKKILKTLDYPVASVSEPERISAGVFCVNAQELLFDVPVFSEPLCLTYTNQRLSRIDGIFFGGAKDAVRVDNTPCISCADALVALLSKRDQIGWVGSSVLSVRQGYRRVDTASSSIRMSPCWRIVTDAGSFYVGGITGEITGIETG